MEKVERQKNTPKVILVLSLIIFGLTGIFTFTYHKTNGSSSANYPNNISNPLEFKSDAELDEFFEDSDATGSFSNPYIFENLYFFSSNSYDNYAYSYSWSYYKPLRLSGISRNVIIRNCTFVGASTGIYINDSIAVCVEDCSFFRGMYGIYSRESGDCRFRNNSFEDFRYCIYNRDSTGTRIYNNFIEDSNYGIYLSNSEGCSIFENQLHFNRGEAVCLKSSTDTNVSDNTFISSIMSIENCNDTLVSSNECDGHPIEFREDQSNITLSYLNWGQLILDNCTNFTISDFPNIRSIFVQNSELITIRNCSFENIHLLEGSLNFDCSYNLTIEECNFTEGETGIRFYYSFYSNITNCSFANMESSFALRYVKNCTIANNSLTNVEYFVHWYYYGISNTFVLFNSLVNSRFSESYDFIHRLTEFRNNTINNLPIGIWESLTNLDFQEEYGCYYIYNCTGFNITDLVLSKFIMLVIESSHMFSIRNVSFIDDLSKIEIIGCRNFEINSLKMSNQIENGLILFGCDFFTLSNINCSNNLGRGLILYGCSFFSVTDSYFNENGCGILSLSCEMGEISSSTIGQNDEIGILVVNGEDMWITNCSLQDNSNGLVLIYGDDIWISNNTITDCSVMGLYGLTCRNMFVANNNMEHNAWDISQENTFYPSPILPHPGNTVSTRYLWRNSSLETSYFSYTYTMIIFYETGYGTIYSYGADIDIGYDFFLTIEVSGRVRLEYLEEHEIPYKSEA